MIICNHIMNTVLSYTVYTYYFVEYLKFFNRQFGVRSVNQSCIVMNVSVNKVMATA